LKDDNRKMNITYYETECEVKMGFFGGGGSTPPAIPPAPKLPEREDPEIKIREQKEKERIRKMKGRKSTILTGASGLEEEAPTERKTLLGA